MSRAHLVPIDRLVALFEGVVATLEAGDAPDLAAFDHELDAPFATLRALGPLDPNGPLAERCRDRLAELARLRAKATAMLSAVRDETGQRLGKLTTGRRGIGAYRATLDDGRRGHGRGQG